MNNKYNKLSVVFDEYILNNNNKKIIIIILNKYIIFIYNNEK